MDYSVKGIPVEEFQTLADLVRLSINAHRSKSLSELREIHTVTDNIHRFDQLTPYATTSKKRETYLGLAAPYLGHIWVDTNQPLLTVKQTLLHELSHLAVPNQSHGPQWRSVYGVALAHWGRRFLEWDEDTIGRRLSSSVVWRYRKHRTTTPDGFSNPYTDFAKRNEEEIEKILRVSRRIR